MLNNYIENISKLTHKQLLLHAVEQKMELAGVQKTIYEPIAVVGMSCRFPSCENTELYWDFLKHGGNAVSEVPAYKWENSDFFDANPEVPGKSYSKWGAVLGNLEKFDAGLFGISPRECRNIDPQQRLLLETSWEALENAGYMQEDLEGSLTGVFAGVSGADFFHLQNEFLGVHKFNSHMITGASNCVAAGRISYTLGLRGPCLAVDTACSSSIVAVHLAMQSLRNRASNLALACAVNIIINPKVYVLLSKARMLSPDGLCKAFDASANGFVRGEGCATVVLKRLSDAKKDRDNILAVLKGSAINHDGRSVGLAAPNSEAQRQVITAALKDASANPDDIDYIEAHGTGTELGDPIEFNAISSVFGKRERKEPLLLGSVKTNLGHLETAAGMASLFKVILSLQHNSIPPHLHLNKVNPLIDLDIIPAVIPTTQTDWFQGDKLRMAGISSFGFGGTNAHIVVEEAPKQERQDHEEHIDGILVLSGMTRQVLNDQAARLNKYLQKDSKTPLNDISYTYNAGRKKFHHRTAVIFSNREDLQEKLGEVASGKTISDINRDNYPDRDDIQIGFLFSGQGTQFSQMGKGLYERFTVFKSFMNQCDEILEKVIGRSLLSFIFSENDNSDLVERTELVQPALFALEYSLAKLWESWGIRPSLVMGHSVGEYAAACCAGMFDLQTGLRLIAKRGQLMGKLSNKGTMASIFAKQNLVERFIAPFSKNVNIAAINGETNIVISGDESIVETILEKLTRQKIRFQQLNVACGFHSSLMNPVLEPFREFSSQFSYKQPDIPLISNVTGEPVKDIVNGHDYWTNHIRKPVLFEKGMKEFDRSGCNIIIEIGPKPTLLSIGKRCFNKPGVSWIPSMSEKESEPERILRSLGDVFLTGKEVDWGNFHGEQQVRRIPLPTYPFSRKYYWYKEPHEKPNNLSTIKQIRPLLDERVQSVKIKETVFQTSIEAHNPSYLIDHKIEGQVVVPCAVYLAMVCNAYEESNKFVAYTLENVRFFNPVLLEGKNVVKVQTILTQREKNATSFEVFYQNFNENDSKEVQWRCDVQGMFLAVDKTREIQSIDIEKHLQKFNTKRNVENYYQDLYDRGYHYGHKFRGIKELYVTEDELFARIELHPSIEFQKKDYPLHPVLFDCCFQAIGTLLKDKTEQIYIPISIDKLTVYQHRLKQLWCYCKSFRSLNKAGSLIEATFELYDTNGFLVAEIDAARFRIVTNDSMRQVPQKSVNESFHEIRWHRDFNIAPDWEDKRGDSDATPRHWLIFSDQAGLGRKLKNALEQRGERCSLIFAGDYYGENETGDFQIDPKNKKEFGNVLQDRCRGSETFYGIVYLWDLDLQEKEPINAVMDSSQSLLYLAQSLGKYSGSTHMRLWLVSKGAETVRNSAEKINLVQTHMAGFSQTIGLEYPGFHCTRVDLDMTGQHDTDALLYELINQDEEKIIAYMNGNRYLARLSNIVSDNIVPSSDVDSIGTAPVGLKISAQGSIENLEFHRVTRDAPKRGEVEVRVLATGMNFRDVVSVLGLYPDGDFPLGGECAGRIVAVGEGVHNFSIGDDVIVIANGSFGSFVTCHTATVRPKPKNLSFAAAASIPIAFLTAYYCLHHLGRISKGDRVLIHAAAGGVGQAALQIAQFFGAEIYATAGSPAKRKFLTEMGVKHVFDSRSLDFADEILSRTNNEGVDIVLNSLTGDFIPKGLCTLGSQGIFLEIGKIGIWDETRVVQFNDRIDYYTVALDRLLENESVRMLAVFDDLLQEFEKGSFSPLPVTSFPFQGVKQAFRYMAETKNVGKIVVTQQDKTDQELYISASEPRIVPDASYLITGGLGGLGLIFAEWVVDQGGRSVFLMGRGGPSKAAESKIEELEAKGATINIVKGSVSQLNDVKNAIDVANNTRERPLRGVFHAAGLVENCLLATETWDNFNIVLKPKVAGGWYLHKLTEQLDLDYFVLFSSVASMLGSPGQSNYATANAFLDGLAAYRVGRGLPAISINWGPWSEVGMGAEKLVRYKTQLSERGIMHISPKFGVKAFEMSSRHNLSRLGVFMMDWSTFTQRLPESVLPFYMNIKRSHSDVKTGKGYLKELLKKNSIAGRHNLLMNHIRTKIANVLQMSSSDEVDIRRSVMELGLDSLMAVELINDIQISLNISIPQTILFDYATVEQLTQHLLKDQLHFATGLEEIQTQKVASQPTDLEIEEVLENVEGEILMEMLEDELSSIENILED